MKVKRTYKDSKEYVKRTCPVCKYSTTTGESHPYNFIKLTTVHNYNEMSDVRLYACPICGTVGIDVREGR